jgi:BlaI family transcriptional regulator, penicillinase repressor
MDRPYLSKREQQVMEIVYRQGEVSAVDVLEALPDRLSNSAVRTFLTILERKGHLTHVEQGGRFIYRPTRPRQNAARTALAGVLKTFFDDSVEKAVATLLSSKEHELSDEELERLQALIEQAKEKGR